MSPNKFKFSTTFSSMEFTQIILSGLIASVLWFIAGGILYMNPFIAKIYKDFKKDPALRKWKDQKIYLASTYFIGGLIPCLLFAFVYAFLYTILPQALLLNTFYFGLLLVILKIIPRLIDMWLQSTYPFKLLMIELVNGIILSFVIAATFAYIALNNLFI